MDVVIVRLGNDWEFKLIDGQAKAEPERRTLDDQRSDPVRLLIDSALLDPPIPMKLVVTIRGTLIAHSEIRDLGQVGRTRIAGLSNTVVLPSYRHRGIYTRVILLRNMVLDSACGDALRFGCVAARVRNEPRYVERYMGLHPGFELVKEKDARGASWLLRGLRGENYDCAAVIRYLEEEVKKW